MEKAKLGTLGDIFIGLSYKPEAVSDKGTIVLRSGNIQDGKINLEDVVRVDGNIKEKLYVKEGDILMCSRNGSARLVGKSALIKSLPEKMTFGAFMTIIRTDKNDYLQYFFKSSHFRKQLKSSATTTINQITRNMLVDIEVPIFSIAESRKIVERLSAVEALINMEQQQILQYDALIKSRFVEVFGNPMTDTSKWQTSTIGEQFDITSGGTPATDEKAYWDNGTIPWIGSNMCQNMILYENDGKFITAEGYAHSSAKWFYNGTVLVALVGATIGKTALLRFDTTTNQNIAAINVNGNKNFSSEFVFYHLQLLYRKFMEISNGKFKMANQGFIRQLPLICPPIELQKQFAVFVKQVDKLKATVQKSLDETQKLFDSLMQQCFG